MFKAFQFKRMPLFLYHPDGDGGTSGNGNGSGEGKVTFTAEQQAHIDKLLGEARVKGRESGVSNGVAEFLKSLKFEKSEDLQAALADYTKLRESQMSDAEKAKAELDAATKRAGELTTQLAEFEALKASKEKYAAAVEGQLKVLKQGLAPHILTLLEKLEPVEQLTYINANAADLRKKPSIIPPTPTPEGEGGSTAAETYLNKTYGKKETAKKE